MRPAIKEILQDTNRQIDELEASAKPTWEALVEPLERLGIAWREPGGLSITSRCSHAPTTFMAVTMRVSVQDT